MTICKICGNERFNREYKIKEMMFGLGDEFSYILCANCGCLQIKEMPTDMSKYYPENYYSFRNFPNQESRIKRMAKKLRDRYAVFDSGVVGRLIYRHFPNEPLRSLSVLPLKKDWTILDVGCGAGILLYSLKELGFKNLLGIDPYIESDIFYTNGLSILKRTIKDLEGQFDLIMFHHSFEHMEEPLGIFREVARLLAPDGFCIIRTPLADSWAWENYGVNWVQIDAPRHFFIHTRKTMEILASYADLKIEKVIYDSTDFQFWGSEQYKKDIPLYAHHSFSINSQESMFSREQIKSFKRRAKELNFEGKGDQAQFYLNKK